MPAIPEAKITTETQTETVFEPPVILLQTVESVPKDFVTNYQKLQYKQYDAPPTLLNEQSNEEAMDLTNNFNSIICF